uniref:Rhodanese domain-containing protein n=1 Tax=viral metagenome TaxID=1070528 RepID=A0A6C0DRS6_9ZZZZ
MTPRTLVLIATVVVLIIVAIALFSHNYVTQSRYMVSPEEAKHLIKVNPGTVVLDTRTELERDVLGYYENSVNLSTETLRLRHPDKKTPIIAYCNTGHRARTAAEALQDMGYTNAVYITATYPKLN